LHDNRNHEQNSVSQLSPSSASQALKETQKTKCLPTAKVVEPQRYEPAPPVSLLLFRPEAGTLNFLNSRDFVSKFKAQRHQVYSSQKENYILQGSIELFLHTT
jgi:hypothetical protein